MLKARVLSAVLGIPLILFFLTTRGYYLFFFTVSLSLVGLYEFFKAMKNVNIHANNAMGYFLTLLYFGAFYLPEAFAHPGLLAAFSVLALFIYEIFFQKHNITEMAITLLGIMYIPYLFSHLLFIDQLRYGSIILWLPFLTAWFSDTCAYFVGIYFGRIKLSPRISPKKTVEGAFGGIFGCIALNIITGFVFNRMGYTIPLIHFAMTGLLCGITSELGDLAASFIKRFAGVKDFGNIIPGHGGILDRFDSILFTAPTIYYYFLIAGF